MDNPGVIFSVTNQNSTNKSRTRGLFSLTLAIKGYGGHRLQSFTVLCCSKQPELRTLHVASYQPNCYTCSQTPRHFAFQRVWERLEALADSTDELNLLADPSLFIPMAAGGGCLILRPLTIIKLTGRGHLRGVALRRLIGL